MKSSTTRWFAIVATAVLMAAGCNREKSEAHSRTTGKVCIADSIQDVRLISAVSCAAGDWTCRAKCIAGNAASCLGLAYAAESDRSKSDEAIRYYHRACVLGAANACTNYAATMWANQHTEDQLTCARRLFEKACAAKEPFACGMVGRLLLESTTPPAYAEGRKFLEKACDEVGGFPCRVLAKHLESGKLGPYQNGLIRTLLARACAGGDPDACGEPKTASETFH